MPQPKHFSANSHITDTFSISTLVGLVTRYYFLSECCEICGLTSVRRLLWREDESAICSVITQRSESRRTRNHTLLSHLRLPQPGGPGSSIYIPQEQGGLVIPPGNGFLLRRLLRLASDDLQGCGGGIQSFSNPEGQVPVYISLRNRMIKSKVKIKSQSHVMTNDQLINLERVEVEVTLRLTVSQ
jgi:hypothetical protein